MKKSITIPLLSLLLLTSLSMDANTIEAQKAQRIDIPFSYINSFIILQVVINNTIPLKFIFDTGAEHTVITQREYTDFLNIDYKRRFRLKGADLDEELYALLAQNISFKIDDFKLGQQRIFVLEDDYFRFQEYNGIDIHGILGAHVFKDYLIQINYQKSILSLFNRKYFESRKNKYQEIAIDVEKGKPFLKTQTAINDSSTINTRLLLDTGASIALLLYTDTHPGIQLPENAIEGNLGMGLGGYVKGFLGRVYNQQFGTFNFPNVLTNFQQLPDMLDSTYAVNRHGIIGNILLSRFMVVFDLGMKKLYVRPMRSISDAFEFDKSGLTIFATGENLDVFYINSVRKNSPAAEADIRPGDVILRINWWSAGSLKLNEINRMLQRKEGKKIRIKILRDGKTFKKQFELRELL